MSSIRGIEAIAFDMDGTLVDSEGYGERAINSLLRAHGIREASEIDHDQLHGVTWDEVSEQLVSAFPQLAETPLAVALQQEFHRMFVDDFPPLIEGAVEAVVAASALAPTAIVSSSNRETVNHLIDHLGLRSHCQVTICAEDCTRSKPEPQCYLRGAASLGHDPRHCLVFEDSIAGLRAAKAAGMWTVAITRNKTKELRSAVMQLADAGIEDFTELPPSFFVAVTGRQPL